VGKIGTLEVNGLFKNKYLYLMIASTFLSSISSIIDKIALKSINVGQMQFWFNLFTFGMFAILYIYKRVKNNETEHFKFSYLIILMSIFLVVSDRAYLHAVKIPESVISIVTPVRRCSIFVSAIVGGFIFKEKNLRKKFICACILILGIALIFWGK
jgi:drug/metabolite transporter (DMT)-like permease